MHESPKDTLHPTGTADKESLPLTDYNLALIYAEMLYGRTGRNIEKSFSRRS